MNSRRRQAWIGIGLLAVLGGGAWLAWRAIETPVPNHNADELHPPPDGALSSRGGQPSTRNEGKPAATDNRRGLTSAQPTHLRGTFSVVDAHGRAFSDQNGSFEAIVWRQGQDWDDGQSLGKVIVKDGRWSIPFDPEVVSLRTNKPTLGNRLVYPDDHLSLPSPLPADYQAQAKGQWLYDATVRVIDRKNGWNLRDVSILSGLGGWSHPGPVADSGPFRQEKDSPFKLGPTDGINGEHWISAPDHAWQRAMLSYRSEDERIIRLEAGGDLQINIVSKESIEGEGLILWQVTQIQKNGKTETVLGERPYSKFRLSAEDKRIELSCMEVGTYQINLDNGDNWNSENPVATVTIRKGKLTTTTIKITKPPKPKPATVSGTVVLPRSWGNLDLSILAFPTFRREHETEVHDLDKVASTAASGPRRLAFAFEVPQPGTYNFHISPIQVRQLVKVGPAGARNIRIQVSEPAQTWVKVLNGETGEPMNDRTQVMWHSQPAGNNDTTRFENAIWKPAKKAFFFRAPIGQVILNVSRDNYGWTSQVLKLTAGYNSSELTLHRACKIKVILKEGATTLPWDGEYDIELKPHDHKGRAITWIDNIVHASDQGDYSVTVSGLIGYKPVTPQRITAVRRETKTVTFQLEPTK